MKRLLFLLISVAAFGQTTPNLNLNIPAYNTQNWQVLMNANFNNLDSYLSGQIGFTLPAFKAAGLTLSGTGLTSNTGTFSGNVTVGGTLGVTGVSTLGVVNGATLNGASSGNSVTLLNYQKSSAAVVGTGSDVVLYTYSLPANTVQNGKGLRITCVLTHSTGSANVTYKVNIGSASQTIGVFGTAATTQRFVAEFANDPASHTSNALWSSAINNVSTASSFATTSVDTSSSQTVTITFSVANTDQVTPDAFLVESIQ